MAPALLHAATLALRAAAAICPASPTCPQNDKCSSTINGVSLQVSCATDYYGGDLQLAQTSTLAACISACSGTSGCVAASFVGGNCYMKSELNAATQNENVVGIAVTARTEVTVTPTSPGQTCPASFTCPENDGCSYTLGSRTLTLACGKDFYGGDIDNLYAESLEACTNACAINTACVAASYVGGKRDGRCYLKGTKNGASSNDNVDGLYINIPSVQSSSVVASSSATSSPSVSVASSSIVSSSSITSSVTSSTPATSASSTVLSSSTIVSSTSTRSTPTATPINLGTCDGVNSGTNSIENPSFEASASSWQLSGNTYAWAYKPAAKCGNNYMIFGPRPGALTSVISQKITTPLDSTRPYAVTFNYAPTNSNGAASCTLQVYANEDQILIKSITGFTNNGYTYQTYRSQFTPKSSDVTLKLQVTCAGADANWSGSYVFFDDITMAPVQ